MEFSCAALLCDLDGTLVDSSLVVERSWRVWAGEYGLDAGAVIGISYGRRSEDTIAELLASSAERARALARIDELELADLEGVVPVPGAADLLACLESRSWAVVTSGNRALMTARIKAARLPTPGVLVTADDVTAGKPDPEGYLLAARRLGVDPADCVVLEDAPAGIEAGKAIGARVLAVTVTHPAEALGEADAVVPDLSGVAVRADGDRLTLLVGGR
jgi:mannitol-1-/sugar-/sorbitol-6-phosphatase